MADDVLEWGSEPVSRPSAGRAIPPVTPYVAAGAGLLAFLLSLIYPWQTLNVVEVATEQSSGYHETLTVWASSSTVGITYIVALLGLSALWAATVAGSRRARRTAGAAGGMVGLGALLVLLAITLTHGRGFLGLNVSSDQFHITGAMEKGLLFAFAAVVLVAGASALALIAAPVRPRPRPVDEEFEEPEDDLDLTVTAA